MRVYFNTKEAARDIEELLKADPEYEKRPDKKRKTIKKDVLYVRGIEREKVYFPILKKLSKAGLADCTDYSKKSPGQLKKGTYRYLISQTQVGFRLYSIHIKTTKGRDISIYAIAHVCKDAETEQEAADIINRMALLCGGSYKSTAAAYARSLWKAQDKASFFKDDKTRALTIYDGEVTADDFCRAAYHGGWCYYKPGRNVVNEPGLRLDKNSLYPSVLREGVPYNRVMFEYVDIATFRDFAVDDDNLCVFVHFSCRYKVKDGFLPFVYKPLDFGGHESNSTSNVTYLSDGRTIDEPIEFVMTLPELRLMFEHYNIRDFVYFEAIGFWKMSCGWYVDPLYEMKQKSTGATRTAVKIISNSTIGSFAKKLNNINVRYSKDGNAIIEQTNSNDSSLISVAAWVNSIAMVKMVKDAQAHYEDFLYCDTDSLHIVGHNTDGLNISENIGDYKIEAEWTHAAFYGSKQYVEYNSTSAKCCIAGCPSEITKIIEKSIIDGTIPKFPAKKQMALMDKRDAENIQLLFEYAFQHIRRGTPAVIPVVNQDGTIGLYGLGTTINIKENTKTAMYMYINHKVQTEEKALQFEDRKAWEMKKYSFYFQYYRIPWKDWAEVKPSCLLTQKERAERIAKKGTDKSPLDINYTGPEKYGWWLIDWVEENEERFMTYEEYEKYKQSRDKAGATDKGKERSKKESAAGYRIH